MHLCDIRFLSITSTHNYLTTDGKCVRLGDSSSLELSQTPERSVVTRNGCRLPVVLTLILGTVVIFHKSIFDVWWNSLKISKCIVFYF